MEPDIARTPIYLMSPPRTDWQLRGRANFRSRDASPADARRARREWSTLADAIVAAGGDVLVCPPAPSAEMTGLIYTAEAGELFLDDSGEPHFLLPNMAVEHRRREADHIGPFFEALGVPTHRVEAKWEAQGDAIRGRGPGEIVHTYGRGPEARTSRRAYREVADLLSRDHVQVAFDADPWFHGNTFMNVYRKQDRNEVLLVVCPEALADEEYGRLVDFLSPVTVHEITREESLGYDTNSLQVDETVIASSTLSDHTADALEAFGFELVALDLSELFSKGGGAPVCLTNRLWRIDASDLPDEHLWSTEPTLDRFD